MKAGAKSETNSAGVFILEVFFLLKSRFFFTCNCLHCIYHCDDHQYMYLHLNLYFCSSHHHSVFHCFHGLR